MKCRMCSQHLTRPGRVCRQCERELERARRAEFVVGELAEVVMQSDNDAMARSRGWTKFRTPRNVIAIAFCVGIAGGAGFVQHHSSRTPRSVMLDVVPASEQRARQHPPGTLPAPPLARAPSRPQV